MSDKPIAPATLFMLMLAIGIPLSFSLSVWLNLVISLICLGYLLVKRVSIKKLALVLLIALPLAFGSWLSFRLFGQRDQVHMAWVYATRVYAYLFLGMIVTLTTSVEALLLSLHLHLKLPSTFVYGLLASFNMIGKVRRQFRKIQYSAFMRQQRYRLWEPGIYFRIILVSLNWSTDLAQAMTSQGFTEGSDRSLVYHEYFANWQWVLVGFLCLLYCFLAFWIKPW